jgi:hypothetical protein
LPAESSSRTSRHEITERSCPPGHGRGSIGRRLGCEAPLPPLDLLPSPYLVIVPERRGDEENAGHVLVDVPICKGPNHERRHRSSGRPAWSRRPCPPARCRSCGAFAGSPFPNISFRSAQDGPEGVKYSRVNAQANVHGQVRCSGLHQPTADGRRGPFPCQRFCHRRPMRQPEQSRG